jgi:hypothetical protein
VSASPSCGWTADAISSFFNHCGKSREGIAVAIGAEVIILDRPDAIERQINETAPEPLAGSAVKLRLLGDPDMEIQTCVSTEDMKSVLQVRDLVERLLGASDGTRFHVAERKRAPRRSSSRFRTRETLGRTPDTLKPAFPR